MRWSPRLRKTGCVGYAGARVPCDFVTYTCIILMQVDIGELYSTLKQALMLCEAWVADATQLLQSALGAAFPALSPADTEVPAGLMAVLSLPSVLPTIDALSPDAAAAALSLDDRARSVPIPSPLKTPVADVARYLRWKAKADRILQCDDGAAVTQAGAARVTLSEVDRLLQQTSEFLVADSERCARIKAALNRASEKCRVWNTKANEELERFQAEAPVPPVAAAVLQSEPFRGSVRVWLYRLSALVEESNALGVTVPATAHKVQWLKDGLTWAEESLSALSTVVSLNVLEGLLASGSRFTDRSNSFAFVAHTHVEESLANANALRQRADKLIQSCNVAVAKSSGQLARLSGDSCWWDHDGATNASAWGIPVVDVEGIISQLSVVKVVMPQLSVVRSMLDRACEWDDAAGCALLESQPSSEMSKLLKEAVSIGIVTPNFRRVLRRYITLLWQSNVQSLLVRCTPSSYTDSTLVRAVTHAVHDGDRLFSSNPCGASCHPDTAFVSQFGDDTRDVRLTWDDARRSAIKFRAASCVGSFDGSRAKEVVAYDIASSVLADATQLGLAADPTVSALQVALQEFESWRVSCVADITAAVRLASHVPLWFPDVHDAMECAPPTVTAKQISDVLSELKALMARLSACVQAGSASKIMQQLYFDAVSLWSRCLTWCVDVMNIVWGPVYSADATVVYARLPLPASALISCAGTAADVLRAGAQLQDESLWPAPSVSSPVVSSRLLARVVAAHDEAERVKAFLGSVLKFTPGATSCTFEEAADVQQLSLHTAVSVAGISEFRDSVARATAWVSDAAGRLTDAEAIIDECTQGSVLPSVFTSFMLGFEDILGKAVQRPWGITERLNVETCQRDVDGALKLCAGLPVLPPSSELNRVRVASSQLQCLLRILDVCCVRSTLDEVVAAHTEAQQLNLFKGSSPSALARAVEDMVAEATEWKSNALSLLMARSRGLPSLREVLVKHCDLHCDVADVRYMLEAEVTRLTDASPMDNSSVSSSSALWMAKYRGLPFWPARAADDAEVQNQDSTSDALPEEGIAMFLFGRNEVVRCVLDDLLPWDGKSAFPFADVNRMVVFPALEAAVAAAKEWASSLSRDQLAAKRKVKRVDGEPPESYRRNRAAADAADADVGTAEDRLMSLLKLKQDTATSSASSPYATPRVGSGSGTYAAVGAVNLNHGSSEVTSMRVRVRENVAKVLTFACHAPSGGSLPSGKFFASFASAIPAKLAEEVENQLLCRFPLPEQSSAYSEQFRVVSFGLRRVVAVIRNVLLGKQSCYSLVRMKPDDFVTEQEKMQQARKQAAMMADAQVSVFNFSDRDVAAAPVQPAATPSLPPPIASSPSAGLLASPGSSSGTNTPAGFVRSVVPTSSRVQPSAVPAQSMDTILASILKESPKPVDMGAPSLASLPPKPVEFTNDPFAKNEAPALSAFTLRTALPRHGGPLHVLAACVGGFGPAYTGPSGPYNATVLPPMLKVSTGRIKLPAFASFLAEMLGGSRRSVFVYAVSSAADGDADDSAVDAIMAEYAESDRLMYIKGTNEDVYVIPRLQLFSARSRIQMSQLAAYGASLKFAHVVVIAKPQDGPAKPADPPAKDRSSKDEKKRKHSEKDHHHHHHHHRDREPGSDRGEPPLKRADIMPSPAPAPVPYDPFSTTPPVPAVSPAGPPSFVPSVAPSPAPATAAASVEDKVASLLSRIQPAGTPRDAPPNPYRPPAYGGYNPGPAAPASAPAPGYNPVYGGSSYGGAPPSYRPGPPPSESPARSYAPPDDYGRPYAPPGPPQRAGDPYYPPPRGGYGGPPPQAGGYPAPDRRAPPTQPGYAPRPYYNPSK